MYIPKFEVPTLLKIKRINEKRNMLRLLEFNLYIIFDIIYYAYLVSDCWKVFNSISYC